MNFVKELKVLLLSVSQQFHPLPSVEANTELAEQLKKLYISKDVKHEPHVSHISHKKISLKNTIKEFRDGLSSPKKSLETREVPLPVLSPIPFIKCRNLGMG